MSERVRHLHITPSVEMAFGSQSALCYGSRPPFRTRSLRLTANLSEVTCKRCLFLVQVVLASRAARPQAEAPRG